MQIVQTHSSASQDELVDPFAQLPPPSAATTYQGLGQFMAAQMQLMSAMMQNMNQMMTQQNQMMTQQNQTAAALLAMLN